MAECWRTGRRNLRAVYRMVGSEPSDDDVCVGLLDTPEIARMFVRAANGGPNPCGDIADGLVRNATPLICTRPDGHDGAHADAWGSVWVATDAGDRGWVGESG